jgi:hypothetical protein
MSFSALILLLVFASCGSACSSPKAPDFNKISNAQNIHFIGEWRTSDGHYFTLDIVSTNPWTKVEDTIWEK